MTKDTETLFYNIRMLIDAKVDTGSFATVISSATMLKLGLEPFVEDWV